MKVHETFPSCARTFSSTEGRLGTRQGGELIIPSKVRLNCFVFFPRFPSSIRQEIPLLVYLDPLDCIDARILRLVDF